MRYVVEVMLPPTVLVDENWQKLQDHQIVLEEASVTELLRLRPTATTVPDNKVEENQESPPLAYLALLKLVVPLMEPPPPPTPTMPSYRKEQ